MYIQSANTSKVRAIRASYKTAGRIQDIPTGTHPYCSSQSSRASGVRTLSSSRPRCHFHEPAKRCRDQLDPDKPSRFNPNIELNRSRSRSLDKRRAPRPRRGAGLSLPVKVQREQQSGLGWTENMTPACPTPSDFSACALRTSA